MTPRISVITLGVADLDRAVRFYADGLGLPRHDKPGVVYFALDGTWLALFPRDALARYAGVAAPIESEPFAGITLSVNVASSAEVDATMERAAGAGARVVKAPETLSWGGYAAWFADPDGHLWEICWNPRPFIPGT